MSIYIYVYTQYDRYAIDGASHRAVHQYLVCFVEAVALTEVDPAEHAGLGCNCSFCLGCVGREYLVDDFRW